MHRSIDVSEWQGHIDGPALAAAALAHAVVRCADPSRTELAGHG